MDERDPTDIALLKERVSRLERRVDTHGEEIDALRIQAEHDSGSASANRRDRHTNTG